jgi:flagellar biosynthetic protein FliS
MSAASLRARYLGDAVATSSPQQVLVMLYDRLALDLERAQKAVAASDRTEASEQLQHAQAIVLELLSSLQVDAWEGGPRLAALYNWLIGELVQANVKLDRVGAAQLNGQTKPFLARPPGLRAPRRGGAPARRQPGGEHVMTGVRPVDGSPGSSFGHSTYAPASAAGGSTTGGRGQERPSVDWASVLSELEGEVLAAEQTLAHGRAEEIAAWGRRSDDWVPPSVLGPVPDDLRERAMRLLQHQLAVAEALIERITQSQRQRDVAARMSYGPSRPVASYIDRAL